MPSLTLRSPSSASVWTITALAFVMGALWRWVRVFVDLDPRSTVFSDMALYMGWAQRIADPNVVLGVTDVTHPPGLSVLLAFALQQDPSLALMQWIQFGVSALFPLALGLLGWLTFGIHNGRAAVVVASVYFPLVDYASYFLAEIHLALLATLTLAAYFGAMRVASVMPAGRRRMAWLLALGAAGGFLFSLAAVMKMVAVFALGGFVVFHVLFSDGPPRRLRLAAVAAALVAATPLNVWQAQRCTRANGGQFCPGSNKAGADFLMGHFGRINGVKWNDPNNIGSCWFASPGATQHGYRDFPMVHFGLPDNAANYAAAWQWVVDNPAAAVTLSVEHVSDLFMGNVPWPAVELEHWTTAQLWQYAFVTLFFIPTVVLLLDLARSRGARAWLSSMELAVASPILGLMLAVALATGEVRYRIPWDGVFILLTIEFFRRWRRGDVPAAATANP